MKKIRLEHILYLLAFLLALGIRLFNLGEAPLSDFEADWAFQSLSLARGESVALGAQPGYIFPTLLFFSLFESANFLARLWPALTGSLLVLAPYAFRHKLGEKAAIIIVFGLAIDPGMVALSRLAGGPMPAIAFTALAFALLFSKRSAWGGIAAGLALLSGPVALFGMLGFGLAMGGAWFLGFFKDEEILPGEEPSEFSERTSTLDWRVVLIFGSGTVLMVGTLFFIHPQGLGAWASTLTAFLQGWGSPSNIPIGRLLAAIFFYGILALLFGLVAIVRGFVQKNKTTQFLSLWLLITVLLPLVYPSRQVGDIAWALLPLWALAGLELARYTQRREGWLISLAQAAMVVVLMIIAWLTLAGLDSASPENVLNYWFVIGAAALIGVLVLVLVYLGWDWPTARTGLVWGLLLGLGVYTLANTFWVSQVRPSSPFELWVPTPTTRHADLFAATLEDIALSQTGNAQHLEIYSLVDAPSMWWVLRDMEGAIFVSSLSDDDNPLVVISREDVSIGSRQEYYRGQDFGWWESPGWGGALPWEPISWVVNRDGVLITEKLVLWARLDLFPEDPASPENTDIDETSPLLLEGVEVEE